MNFDGDKTVAHSNGSKILLTVEDRKIDESFECVEKGLSWGGFEALAAGICIGALVVATVATGGLALAATGVMFAAAGATVISGVGGIISIAHACDCTLESKWVGKSSSVRFNKHAALLNRSLMKCINKGTIFVESDIYDRTSIKARINKYELNSPRYGSKENPVPVLDYDYDLQRLRSAYDDKEYEYAFCRPSYYKRAVELYLTYMMSKEEFKERFKKE